MPSKKDKESKPEKASGDAATDMVLKYLITQNRPYSAIEISANLHNAVTKTLATKILKDLYERKEIEGRASGKQLVYHAIQPEQVPAPENLQEINLATVNLRSEISALSNALKNLKSQLHQARSSVPPSVDALREKLTAAEIEREQLLTKLLPLRSGSVKPVDPDEKSRLDNEVRLWRGMAMRRKRIVKEMWGVISDGVAGGGGGEAEIAELKEKLGVEL